MTLFREGKTNWKYILIIVILAFIVGGGVLSYNWHMERKEVKVMELKILEKEERLQEIPSSIALDDELLERFLIEQKIIKTGERYSEVGLEFSKVIREDLDQDGKKEIIVGFGFFGPTMGWIGLIREKDGKYLLLQWESIGNIVDIERKKNFPRPFHQSVIIKTDDHLGTGLCSKTMFIYLIDKPGGQLKLIWHGFLRDFGSAGSVGSIGHDNEFSIEFTDINDDGNIEIIQSGVIKKIQVSESFEDVTLKETPVKNIFRYNYDTSQYEICCNSHHFSP